MIEAAMIWNEPNNKSHWSFELDPDWSRFAVLVRGRLNTSACGHCTGRMRFPQPMRLSSELRE